MEPDSTVLVVLLLIVSAALVTAAIRFRPVAVKILASALALVLASVAGIAMVNVYYGYYQTWSRLADDLSNTYSAFTPVHAAARTAGPTRRGRLENVVLRGARSGITRAGLVYLPSQYFEPRYAHTRFPAVELVHGSPGKPDNWVSQFDIATLMDRLISRNLMGPVIVVMPAMNAGNQFQECVDAAGALDDTYISQDVPNDVRGQFRVSRMPSEWGIAGYSSGGYCAANLALRHRDAFGAAGILEGYFRPIDGPAAAALHFDAQAEARNDPLLAAQRLTRGTNPMPSLWISTGTGNTKYDKGAEAFIAALHGVETVTLSRERGAHHNFYALRPAVPRMLSWMWTQLAAPALRVQFPIAGPVDNSIIVAPKPRQASGTTSLPAHARPPRPRPTATHP